MAARNIADWQRRFYAGLSVWATFFRDEGGVEEIGDLYESSEAAQLEVDWYRRQGKKGRRLPVIRQVHIHTLDLAAERWGTE